MYPSAAEAPQPLAGLAPQGALPAAALLNNDDGDDDDDDLVEITCALCPPWLLRKKMGL